MPVSSLYSATDSMLRCGEHGQCALEHVVCMHQAPHTEQTQCHNRVKQKAEICYSEKHCSLTRDNLVIAAASCTAPSDMLSPALQTCMQENIGRQACVEPRLMPQLDMCASHLC